MFGKTDRQIDRWRVGEHRQKMMTVMQNAIEEEDEAMDWQDGVVASILVLNT